MKAFPLYLFCFGALLVGAFVADSMAAKGWLVLAAMILTILMMYVVVFRRKY